MTGAVMTAAGAVLLVLAGWSWLGRSHLARWWTRRWQGDTIALGITPGMGLLLLGPGLVALSDPVGGVLRPVGALVWLASFPVLIIGWWSPRWWGPAWWRALSPTARAALLSDPLGRMLVDRDRAASRPAPHEETAAVGWGVGWLPGPGDRRGTVVGTLRLTGQDLRFSSSSTPAGGGTPGDDLVIPLSYVMAARAEPPVSGRHERLVVDAGTTSHVFEITGGPAARVSSTIQQAIEEPTR